MIRALADFEAYLFDLDGVLTPTATVHMRAWQQTFDQFFAQESIAPAYTDADYFAYVDGKKRYDGVASLLASRGFELPFGDPSDSPGSRTVCGVGNRKNAVFKSLIAVGGIEAFADAVALLDELRSRPLAVVSSSKNAEEVLRGAGLRERFAVVIDGVVAEREGLPSKPDPAVFLRGAELLCVDPAHAVAFEDAVSGVQSAVAGGFGFVVGVDRVGESAALRAAGAHIIVHELTELIS